MLKICFIFSLLILWLSLSGCSIQADQNLQATPFPTTSPTLTNTNVEKPTEQTRIGNPALPAFQIPVTWENLKLTGKLIYTSAGQDGNTPFLRIQSLDLVTGEGTTIFEAPSTAWIYFVAVSPDEKELVMAYTPPITSDGSSNQALYVMPLDGSKLPQLLFLPPTAQDEYFQPEWSPDGKYLYFSHQMPPKTKNEHYPIDEIYRMAYPDGPAEKIADESFWPRLSADASRLLYVSIDPVTGTNKLFLADADGKNAQQVVLSGNVIPDYIDAPIFSPDNQSILFSAVDPVQASAPTWYERLLGMTVASAHVVPSDWFSVPLAGGAPTALTELKTIGLFASISPDKQYIASYSGNGIFVMRPDGTGSMVLISDLGGVPGTVSWIP